MEDKKQKKRRRSSLTLYMDRVSEGDESYREKLCKSLVDRLLYIPLDTSEDSYSESRTEGVTIRVMRMKYAGKEVVPVFTDEQMYREWQATQTKELESVALLGGDLCKVLHPGLWLLLDYGSESEVVIDEHMVDSIAYFGDQALEAEFGSGIVELKETDIIELTVALDEVSDSFKPSEPMQKKEEEQPRGLKGWLGV